MTAARPAAGKIKGRRRFAMALRLVTAVAGDRGLRNLGFALLLLGVMVMRAGPAPAQEAGEAYSGTVRVDARADSAAAAREAARIDGQRRALTAVIDRLSGSSENS